jgi:hypothetical protein
MFPAVCEVMKSGVPQPAVWVPIRYRVSEFCHRLARCPQFRDLGGDGLRLRRIVAVRKLADGGWPHLLWSDWSSTQTVLGLVVPVLREALAGHVCRADGPVLMWQAMSGTICTRRAADGP